MDFDGEWQTVYYGRRGRSRQQTFNSRPHTQDQDWSFSTRGGEGTVGLTEHSPVPSSGNGAETHVLTRQGHGLGGDTSLDGRTVHSLASISGGGGGWCSPKPKYSPSPAPTLTTPPH